MTERQGIDLESRRVSIVGSNPAAPFLFLLLK